MNDAEKTTRFLLEELVACGADLNFESGEGQRPLWSACLGGRPEMVELLLRLGADPNFIIEETESLLDRVEFDRWYSHTQIGTAWERDHAEAIDDAARRSVYTVERA